MNYHGACYLEVKEKITYVEEVGTARRRHDADVDTATESGTVPSSHGDVQVFWR